MGNNISKIGPHVYVKGSAEAIKLYKNAFGLEDKGRPAVDSEGDIYYHTLAKSGKFFIGISEDKYMQAAIRRENVGDACLQWFLP